MTAAAAGGGGAGGDGGAAGLPPAPPAVAEQFGELLLVATYTEDCYQPSFLQSLFCNVMYW